MNFKKTSAIVLAISFALIVLISEFAIANEGDEQEAQSAGTSSNNEREPTRIMKNTYMGVDASDKEAVEKRIRELSLHKWNEMFGADTDIDDLEFNLDFSGGLLEHAKQKIKNALEALRSYVKNRRNPTTTPEPSTST